MDELWLIGRILFGAYFVTTGIGILADIPVATQYVSDRGVAQAKNGVVVTGIAYVVGGASVILGLWGDIGALLLIVTLIPVTFLMHKFWAERDPAAKQLQISQFMKNIALIGGAVLLFTSFGRDTFGFGLPYTITDGLFGIR